MDQEIQPLQQPYSMPSSQMEQSFGGSMSTSQEPKNRKRIILIIATVVILIIGVAIAFLAMSSKPVLDDSMMATISGAQEKASELELIYGELLSSNDPVPPLSIEKIESIEAKVNELDTDLQTIFSAGGISGVDQEKFDAIKTTSLDALNVYREDLHDIKSITTVYFVPLNDLIKDPTTKITLADDSSLINSQKEGISTVASSLREAFIGLSDVYSQLSALGCLDSSQLAGVDCSEEGQAELSTKFTSSLQFVKGGVEEMRRIFGGPDALISAQLKGLSQNE